LSISCFGTLVATDTISHNETKHKSTPTRVPVVDFVKRMEERKQWLGKRIRATYVKDDFVHLHGVN